METVGASKLNETLEAVAWGALLMWWGVTELFSFLPNGTGAIGVGLILLGLNVIRSLNGFSTRAWTTMFGILALVWGGLDLAGSLLRLSFEMPTFAILLIVLGAMVLGRGLLRNRKE